LTAGPESSAAAVLIARREWPRELSSQVKITNPHFRSRESVRRRDAEHYRDAGRAEYLGRGPDGKDQIRLLDSNARAVPGYDDVDDFFEFTKGFSDGAAVLKMLGRRAK
jgi:hypothetical protein